MSFSRIAKVYDRFNDLEVYEQWLDFTLNSVDQQPQKVLDVACGTGWFTSLLAPFVTSITGMDIDNEMLEMARSEDPEQVVQYVQGDMLSMETFASDYDLVTCYADSLCFLENAEQVQQAIRQMLNRLAPGGTLLFDVWTPYQVTTGFDGFSYFDSDETAALLWDSAVDAETLTMEHYLTVFMQQQDGRYDREEVVLTERAYPLSVYQAAFDNDEVASVEVLANFGEAIYDEMTHQEAERWFFRVVKR
ncbi:class I SAM-dependent methyltransferase [Aerococcaceae bacterium zg-ZUI334]|uniref:class I SAM-dependent DNA methyltransferase n=1 Tax=Aerococcaceae bacterium zg-252 TaxID=2796928 RepID=UPI001BA0BBCF|nr:class I SAM-dependent methyltransferase [Aerococcaceae bacterium zg-ZUI334]